MDKIELPIIERLIRIYRRMAQKGFEESKKRIAGEGASNKETERIGNILKQLMTKEIDKLKKQKENK